MSRSEEEGKVAIITGAARGIGRASALALARDGVDVVIADVDFECAQATAAEIATETGRQTMPSSVDVSDLQSVDALVTKVTERFGRIDILVNNAGIIRDGLLIRMTDEQWHRVIDINLNGTFYCTRAVIRTMLRQRWGRVISISSIVGLRGNAGQTNYAASKAGIIGFTKALAKEVATRNITVNAVTPGYISTATVDVLPQELKKRVLKSVPQGKFGEAEDVAHMVAFLASEKARYVTGQAISVDGGLAV